MKDAIHNTARELYRLWRPGKRNSLRLALLLRAHDRSPKPIDAFSEKRILVLAPHADDEILGCGGSLALHARSGAEIAVVFMTDGRWGDADLLVGDLSGKQRRQLQAQLVDTRKREAHLSSALLGIQRLYFLNAEDGKLKPNRGAVEKLYRILSELKPDCVYLPFLMDGHEDHWQTNRVFYTALSQLARIDMDLPRCRGYEVWSPLVANRIVNISDVMEKKIAALRLYQSQLKDSGYAKCIKGINAYRAMHIGAKGYAEAFFECTAQEYKALFEEMVGNS